MKFETNEAYHAVVFTPKGKMMGGPDNAKFHDAIKAYLDQGKKNFVVDLGNVDWMNSPGLGILITAFTSVKNAGGELGDRPADQEGQVPVCDYSARENLQDFRRD